MLKTAATLLLLLLTALAGAQAETPAAVPAVPGVAASEAKAAVTPTATTPAAIVPAVPSRHVVVYVIPVRDEINKPILYILRRGLKEAIDQKADTVVLDMNTPGGALDVTFDIMEALGNFHGETLTYVNKEAMSAGAFISATTGEIWFAPHAVIGAAAPVSSGGADIDVTMKQKVVSYLKARVRAISEDKGYRGEVVSAMIDADYELKLGDKVIKPKGELLSLTDTEALKPYGEPPLPLLGAGIAQDLGALLTKKYGAGNFTIRQFQVTWSEELAQYLTKLSPILLGLGLLALFIEFKTPGFGFFGVAGIGLLAVVFLSNYVAGLSGHEPLLLFSVGLLLVALELMFFHSAGVLGVVGLMLMGGSLVWSMADIWPNQPVSVAWSTDLLVEPLKNLLFGLVMAGGLLALVARFLPHGWIWQRLAVRGAVAGAGVATAVLHEQEALVGRDGVAATSLFPSGQVEIDGRRYEARLEVGFVEAGTPIRVVRRTGFALIVEAKTP